MVVGPRALALGAASLLALLVGALPLASRADASVLRGGIGRSDPFQSQRPPAKPTRARDGGRGKPPPPKMREPVRVTRVGLALPMEGCLVRGRVLRRSEGAERVSVSLSPRGSGWDEAKLKAFDLPRLARTGEGGAFEFPSVPPGEVEISATADEGGAAAVRAMVPDAEEFEVDVRFPGGEIAGRVVSVTDRSPLPRFSVAAVGLAGGAGVGRLFRTTTGEDGRYRVRDLPPGAYAVRVVPPFPWKAETSPSAPAPEERSPVTVGQETPTVLDFAPSTGGRAVVWVRDAQGEPRPDARVELFLAGSRDGDLPETSTWWTGPTSWTASAGAGGAARFYGLSAGTYFAVARVSGFAANASAETPIRLGEEGSLCVDLQEGTLTSVHVLSPTGLRPSGVSCSFRDERGIATSSRDRDEPGRRRSGGEGPHVLRLLPGNYTLRVRASGCRESTVPVVVGSASPQELEIRLEPGEALSSDSRR